MNDFYLLSRTPCPLCNEAIRMINSCSLEEPIRLHMVDIEQDTDLQREYGWLIPVVIRAEDDAELKWPFDQQQLTGFLEERGIK